jgi:hypothetical protein
MSRGRFPSRTAETAIGRDHLSGQGHRIMHLIAEEALRKLIDNGVKSASDPTTIRTRP